MPNDTRSSASSKINTLLLWVVVCLPLIWGVMKTWDEVKLMF